MRRALSLGTGTTLVDGSASMLTRVLLAMVVGCMAVLIACADEDTASDVAPERQEQQAAVEIEQERSSERGEAAPGSAAAAETTQETQSTKTSANSEPADSEFSEQPESTSADALASQSASGDPPAETSETNASTATEDQANESIGEAAAEVETEPALEPPQRQAETLEATASDAASTQSKSTNPEPANAIEEEATPERTTKPVSESDQITVAALADPSEKTYVPGILTRGPIGGEQRIAPSDKPGDPPPDGQDPEPVSMASAQGPSYSWQDGDHTRTVRLQTDLVIETGAARGESAGGIVRKQAGDALQDTNPVFRSESGQLMTLPGGVLLALDPDWEERAIDMFFASNGIDRSQVSEHQFARNGFFIETEPGFPSLTLANALAGQDGVLLSSPNWQSEAATR